MNLRWNSGLGRFEAEFSSDFHGDLAAVKAAGFKTTGAPDWIWYALTTTPLAKLKETRPASGLTINPDARAEYNKLAEIDKRNEETKAQLAEHKKALKKKLTKEKQEGERHVLIIPEKGYIDVSDLPPMPPQANVYVPPPPPETRCLICNDPVYFYEKQAPSICLWCEKIVLDNAPEVC